MRLNVVCICLTAVMFSLSGASAADDMSTAEKWAGTMVNRGGSSMGIEFSIVQSGQNIAGTVSVRGRPVPNSRMPKDFDTKITGKVEGRSVVLEWWNPESRKNIATLTLADDGKTLGGTFQQEGAQASGQINLSKAAN